VLIGLIGGTALWLLLLRDVMTGKAAMLVHVAILFASVVLGLRVVTRDYDRVLLELGRICANCESFIEDPEGCGDAIYL
jgi:hypothetical protein